jgi:hypothetical protein
VPPAYDYLSSGEGVESEGWPVMEVYCQFDVYCSGDFHMGGHPDGYPEEWIWRRYPYTPSNQPFDSGWTGVSEYYYQDGGAIHDRKRHDVTGGESLWNLYDVGDVFDEFKQQNRMIVADCHGVYHAYEFGTRTFQKVKTGPKSWKLIKLW